MTGTQLDTMADITLYAWATPNSRRVTIMLEELGLRYRIHPVNIRAGDQFRPPMTTLNPFGKIPVLCWSDDAGAHVLAESGAILVALAEYHSALLPLEYSARHNVMQWLMVALTALAPATGQAHHWRSLASERSDAAIKHAVSAVRRVYALLDSRLGEQAYLAGAYSIADIAAYPWVDRSEWAGLVLHEYPSVKRWFDQLSERDAVGRGMAQPQGAALV